MKKCKICKILIDEGDLCEDCSRITDKVQKGYCVQCQKAIPYGERHYLAYGNYCGSCHTESNKALKPDYEIKLNL